MDEQDAGNNQHRGLLLPSDHVIRGKATMASIKVYKPTRGTGYAWVYLVCVGLEQMNQKMIRAPLPEVRRIVREAKDWIDEHMRVHGALSHQEFIFYWYD